MTDDWQAQVEEMKRLGPSYMEMYPDRRWYYVRWSDMCRVNGETKGTQMYIDEQLKRRSVGHI